MAEMDWVAAVEKWQQAIHLGYSSETAYVNLARVYERIDNRPLAIQTLRHYIDQHADSFNVHLRLAELYARQGRWREASEQSLLAIQVDPSGFGAQLFYLRCQIEIMPLNQDADKRVLMQKIQEQIQAADSSESRMLLFRLAFKLKDYELARTTLDQIEQKYGENDQISIRRAELVMASGKAQDGIAYLEEAVQKHPGVNEITRLLALSYNQNNQADKSRRLLENAYERATDPVQRRQCRLWLAELSVLQDNKEAAIQMYSAMAQANVSDIFVRRQLLTFQYNQTDRGQLQQWIDQIKSAEGE
ncbi:MAG: tetratricopeptide repeat protein, partial [Pseudomonadota bacterium]